ncbi:MAG TPA: LysR substrate-binding domain-containing protein [Ancylobacter sp.]
MPQPLDLDLLKTFVAVVESGSFSNAAPLVGRSQSAVSMQMQRLEQSIGRELLARGPQAARPNAAGEELLIHARKLLRLSDEARAAITRPDEVGCVRLGVPEDYVAQFLPPVLAQFAAEHPLVAVELICEASRHLVTAIQNGRIDLAIVTRMPSQTFDVQRREPLVWVASHNHIAWESDPLPIALFEAGCGPAHSRVLEALNGAARAYRVAYSSASLAGLIAVVEAGVAVAGLPRCSVPPSLRIVSQREGLPFIQELEMSVLRGPLPDSSAAQRLHDFLTRELSR